MLLINAVKARDVPIVMGTVIFVTIIVGIINLVVDIVCALIDPLGWNKRCQQNRDYDDRQKYHAKHGKFILAESEHDQFACAVF